MSAVILVLNDPYFVIPDATGRYTLEGVPPGEYQLVAWHERAKPVKKNIKFAAGDSLVMDMSVPITDER